VVHPTNNDPDWSAPMPATATVESNVTGLLPLPLQIADPHLFDRSPVDQLKEQAAAIATSYDRREQISHAPIEASSTTKQVCCEVIEFTDFLVSDTKIDDI
jgi:hypothetical protein